MSIQENRFGVPVLTSSPDLLPESRLIGVSRAHLSLAQASLQQAQDSPPTTGLRVGEAHHVCPRAGNRVRQTALRRQQGRLLSSRPSHRGSLWFLLFREKKDSKKIVAFSTVRNIFMSRRAGTSHAGEHSAPEGSTRKGKGGGGDGGEEEERHRKQESRNEQLTWVCWKMRGLLYYLPFIKPLQILSCNITT